MSTGSILIGPFEFGDNVSVASNSMVYKGRGFSNVLFVGSPAYVKKESDAWWIRDGWEEKINQIELLKSKMLGK